MQNRSVGKKHCFRQLLTLPRIYFFLLKSLFKQKRFIKNQLKKELTGFRKTNDGSLTLADFRKIRSYYALGVPGILGESLAVLRGQSLSTKERHCLTFLSAISGLLDDLFDDPNKEVQHLRDFILDPEILKPANSYEALLVHLYTLGLSYATQPERIKNQALQVYEAQQKSLQQQKAENPNQLIHEITYSKGGSSFLFYRLCLEQLPEKAEVKLVSHLGGLMQLGNDVFDVWEDFHSGTKTSANTCFSIQQLRKDFSADLSTLFELAEKTSYSKKQIERFLNIISLALARVFACLDQFEKLEINTNNKFQIDKYSRKQLICDMQKPKNQIKAMRYFIDNPAIKV
ncbi:class 1 isoprenoid biosynthesis enzyme [Gillisia limnaea]|uniref:Uncharacterized protein n=1 Tax=Gillisia limnaea (strain DSM 15749 / LMG 21470 / R-8282) TaxID=865937 RepID=H2BU13_GILLR|nr:class 1 isoprenoid biosynthesis enzyme [Gillisia limnaea]EHQ01609.1 hypothetical protein Gilli_0922 [Gillisia limnaea DSM 15749]